MPTIVRVITLTLSLSLLTGFSPRAIAESITAAPDGTGTRVTPDGNLVNISGGTQTGANLFHSFKQFNLNADQTANFLAHPGILNILGRVVGGDASVINGRLQVTGSHANLFLLNPAGLLFGPKASLNLPAAFTATTANGIQLGTGWFKAIGPNAYTTLGGEPTGFAFSTVQPGAIVNAGNLSVGPGQTLTLLGGLVLNTGTLTAPGGRITIAALPGEKLVRLTPSGSLLSLDLPLTTQAELNTAGIVPLSLPALLTGGQLGSATGVTVENNVVRLTQGATEIPTTPGTAIVSGQVSVVPSSSLTPTTPQIAILGTQVGLFQAHVNASGPWGGGTILIGGDYQGQGTVPTAQQTFVDSNSQIAADAEIHGNGGQVIVWADNTTRFGGSITAQGGPLGGNGGQVETSGKQGLAVTGRVDTRAPQGLAGTWLLDPSDLTIAASSTTADSSTTPGTQTFFTPLSGAVIGAADITKALQTSNVSITTAGAGNGNGDIFLTAPVTANTANRTLTLTGRYLLPSNGATLNLLGDNSHLVLNLNAVNPERNQSIPAARIQSGLNAVGTVHGSTTLNLGAGTYVGSVVIDARTSNTLTLQGAGIGSTIVQGTGTGRVFDILAGNVILAGLTITQGVELTGGGIRNQGTLSLIDSQVSGNQARSTGGGIWNAPQASLTVTRSRIQDNQATAGGGGVFNSPGSIAIFNSSEVSRNSTTNSGGGIFNQGMLILEQTYLGDNQASNRGGGLFNTWVATVTESSFSSNQAGNAGGGIANEPSSSLTLSQSRLSQNQAGNQGGSLFNRGIVTLTQSQVLNSQAGNQGGGVFNDGTMSAIASLFDGNTAQNGAGAIFNRNLLSLTTSTVSHNRSTDGGGILNDGWLQLDRSTLSSNAAVDRGGGMLNRQRLTISNSTLSGNQAAQAGGIFNQGRLTIDSSTLSRNGATTQAGGILNAADAFTSLSNTILAGNESPNGVDAKGQFDDGGNNLIGIRNGAVGFSRSFLIGTLAAPLNPRLAPLADNDGPTQTHALLPGSPALGAGKLTPSPAIDQRGLPRFVKGNRDIGAFEQERSSPSSPSNPLVPDPSNLPQAEKTVLSPATLPSELEPLQAPITPPPLTGMTPVPQRVLQQTPAAVQSDAALAALDASFSQDYDNYLQLQPAPGMTVKQLQQVLTTAQQQKGVQSAVIYAVFVPSAIAAAQPTQQAMSGLSSIPLIFRVKEKRNDDRLELVRVTATGVTRYVTSATRAQVVQQAKLFRLTVADPEDDRGFVALAKQLYGWLLQPLEADLQHAGITSLIYCLDDGLRTVPIPAMLSDRGFAIARYTLSIIPSIGLLDTKITQLHQQPMLAMGVDHFPSLEPLPAVPTEIHLISDRLWKGKSFLNQESTLSGMLDKTKRYDPGLLHLATHAEFNQGAPDRSFIQLWDRKITLDQMRSLNWRSLSLELLVLSACTTALGSPQAELGFAGLAAASGVRSVLGSLWAISDVGTLALMSEFYSQLKRVPTRAEALQQAQLALLEGKVRIEAGQLVTSGGTFPLPDHLVPPRGTFTFNHPFYWSAFTLIGNPW